MNGEKRVRNMRIRRWLFAALSVALAVWLCVALGLPRDVLSRDPERPLRIGATYMTMNNPFYSVLDEELRLTVEGNGDLLLTRNPALDQEKQSEQIHDLLKEGIDLLVVNPVDYTEIRPALMEARRMGVPVVVVDSPVSDPSLVACTVASDNYNAGVLCAQALMRTRPRAHIVLLEHPTAQSAVERIQGFCDTIAGDEKYEILGRESCNGQLEQAMPAMERLIDQYGDKIQVVMALNDPAAMGAMAALEERGRLADTDVYGVDGAPEAKGMIAEGAMAATVAQSPLKLAQQTAQAVYHILRDERCESQVVVPVELVTRENVARFGTDGWQ